MTRTAILLLGASLIGVPPSKGATPALVGLSDDSAPRSGRIVLSGSGFGNVQGSSYVEIAGAAAPVTLWSDGAITAYVLGSVPLGETSVRVVTSEGTSGARPLIVEPAGSGTGHVAWRFRMDTPYMSHRAAVAPDGTVYAQDVRGFVYALASDGSLLWIVNAAGYPNGGGGEGPVALGVDGSVYVVANPLGPQVKILALDPVDGSTRWTFSDTNTQGVIAGPNVGPDGNLYFVTDLGGRGVTSVTPDGNYRWSEVGSPPVEEHGQLGEEIAFGLNEQGALQLYCAFDCVETSLTSLLFGFTALEGDQRFAVTTGLQGDPLGQRQGQPATGPDGTVYLSALITTTGWRLQQFDPDTGVRGWIYGGSLTNAMSEPDVGPSGVIYVTRNTSQVHAVNPDGSHRWSHSDGTLHFAPIASPASDAVIVGGRITYGAPGFVKLFDTGGTLLWTEALPSEMGVSMIPFSRAIFSGDGTRAYMGTALPGLPDGQEYCYLYAFDVGPSSVGASPAIAGSFELRVHPNPFREATEVFCSWPGPATARLQIFDVRGRPVRSLSGSVPGAFRWDGRDSGGQAVSNGLYFYRLAAGERSATGKLVLVE